MQLNENYDFKCVRIQIYVSKHMNFDNNGNVLNLVPHCVALLDFVQIDYYNVNAIFVTNFACQTTVVVKLLLFLVSKLKHHLNACVKTAY